MSGHRDSTVITGDIHGPHPKWKSTLPSPLALYRQEFGKPDSSHSFTQEACGETIMHFVFKSGFLNYSDTCKAHSVHPLWRHLDRSRQQLTSYDFTSLRNINRVWATQTSIPPEKAKGMLACLLHYDLDVSLLMRYLGNNYTASHRKVGEIVEKIRPFVTPELIQHYIRVMTVGCPRHLVAETSRTNAVRYWRAGNNPSIRQKLDQVMKTMNKEEKNNFVIPLPGWTWRFIPHLFYTPQHILEKVGKPDRQIFDAAFRHDANSIPINMMTSTSEGVELHCEFGDVLTRLLTRIWNLRITYPHHDVVLHANDVKSCFRQLKHHPDVMGAFSYILGDYLFLQCGLTFGADFSPASWEVIRRIVEQLAEGLFTDATLPAKHRKYLERLRWKKNLGQTNAKLAPAKADSINQGVLDAKGQPVNTPHDLFVDDDVYAEVFQKGRIEQAIAASIEAIFILLGESDLVLRQDTVSFDKLEDTMVNWNNRILGRLINARSLTVATPSEYIRSTAELIRVRWHRRRQHFFISDIETLTGQLGHISETAHWLRFLMPHIYASLTHALKASQNRLIRTSKDFRKLLKLIKQNRSVSTEPTPTCKTQLGREISYAQSVTAKAVHHSRSKYDFNPTLRIELHLIYQIFTSSWVDMTRPIGHMIKREPSAIGYSDSSLHAAGGYSLDMGFWWYIEWPPEVQSHTLRFVKNDKHNTLISINVLEYAAGIINYIASMHFYTTCPNKSDPTPIVLLYDDNTASESWLMKGCKSSRIGRGLGRLQCSLMINSPVGLDVAHITTDENVIADRISRFKRETDILSNISLLKQEFPQLISCRRFHPSAELSSAIIAILLQEKSFDPLVARNRVLETLGKSTI